MYGKVAVCTFKRVLTSGEIDGKKASCPELKNGVEIFNKRHLPATGLYDDRAQ